MVATTIATVTQPPEMATIEETAAQTMAADQGHDTLDPPAAVVGEESQPRTRRRLRSFSFSEVEKLHTCRRRDLEDVVEPQAEDGNSDASDDPLPNSTKAQHSLVEDYLFCRSQSDSISYRQARKSIRFSILDAAGSPSERRRRRFGRNNSMPAGFDHIDSPINVEVTDDDDDLTPLTQKVEGIFRPRRLSAPGSMGLRVSTIKSSSTGATDDCDDEASKSKVTPVEPFQQELHRRRQKKQDRETSNNERSDKKQPLSWKTIQLPYVMYLSVFAIFGSILRVYLARFFGGDCEDHSIRDFLTPISRQICVTSTGRTLQTGGALFVDLPANMLGSFVMGLITPPDQDHSLRLPWLRKNNPLQKDDVLHAAFSVGFCGSLTTFASWNSQMVVMLDGTHTELGSQVVTAIFGYLLGMIAAIASFTYGRQLSSWLQVWRNPLEIGPVCSDDAMDLEEGGDPASENVSSQSSALDHSSSSPNDESSSTPSIYTTATLACRPKNSVFILVIGLLASFVVADVMFGIRFYRKLYLLCLLSPAGALLRWNLAYFNIPKQRRASGAPLDWVPWGTLTANIVGAFFSIVFVGLGDRFANNGREYNEWTLLIFGGLTTGFAGSLSTVSSMVKEIVLLSEKYPGHSKPCQYACFTLSMSLFLGMVVYSTIVRY